MRMSVNIGFITNSSSCVFYFPPEVLQDETVSAFLSSYGLLDGFVSSDVWHRGGCDSLAITSEQKRELYGQLASCEYGSGGHLVDPKAEGVYVVYGDEYHNVAHILCNLMSQAYAKLQNLENPFHAGYVGDFN